LFTQYAFRAIETFPVVATLIRPVVYYEKVIL